MDARFVWLNMEETLLSDVKARIAQGNASQTRSQWWVELILLGR